MTFLQNLKNQNKFIQYLKLKAEVIIIQKPEQLVGIQILDLLLEKVLIYLQPLFLTMKVIMIYSMIKTLNNLKLMQIPQINNMETKKKKELLKVQNNKLHLS